MNIEKEVLETPPNLDPIVEEDQFNEEKEDMFGEDDDDEDYNYDYE